MQVPPIVPSFAPSELKPASRTVAAQLSRIGWIAFAVFLAGLCASLLTHAEFRHRLPLTALVTAVFALAAWLLRGVNRSGAASGFIAAFALTIAGGPAIFGAVLLVFVLTFLATRFGRQRKSELHIEERGKGRNGAQVLANIGCAAVAATLSQLTPWHMPLLAGSIAALSEAAADTVSSETGKALARTARMLNSWKMVSAGTDGAISLAGTILGIAAAGIVGAEAVATGMLNARQSGIAVLAGMTGMFIDSLLGATLEARGWIGNNGVNLISTGCSVVLAAILV
jgi:uncharacterized protein (TIGR00297 family)